MAGWACKDREEIEWDGTIKATHGFVGDGTRITGIVAVGDNLGNHIATQTVSGSIVDMTGYVSGALIYGDGSNLTNLPAGTIRLDQVTNPNDDKTFNMGNNHLTFRFNQPVGSASGALEIEGFGGYEGDLLHIHQHIGNPGNVQLIHLEADDADVMPLIIRSAGTISIDANKIISGAYIHANGTDLYAAHELTSGAYIAHAEDFINPHGAYTSQAQLVIGSGAITYDGDELSGARLQNIVLGTGSTPPTASNFARGTIYVEYTP